MTAKKPIAVDIDEIVSSPWIGLHYRHEFLLHHRHERLELGPNQGTRRRGAEALGEVMVGTKSEPTSLSSLTEGNQGGI